jgi:mRNA-degrading endonuclease RelE of RelBE toxin-antitoxin system
MEYEISLTESAKKDIVFYEATDQRIIAAGIITHLKSEAERETRRKKQLRPNPVAPWELRLDKFRVFYSIEGAPK